ncbi:MAG TPA: PD-(D/E)XK nuclease family protein [Candidatus Absconditabacterales bacterium]|nr:PD-(D/E)XK nuclease family protein [Candidatus Absconditabacterales bacterium]
MSEFKNPLSRSISKSTVLHFCKKKYYFSTYSNYLNEVDKGLWIQALLAKNLKSVYMRFGEKMHDLISDYLNLVKTGDDNLDKIKKTKEDLINQMDQEYSVSKNRDYLKYDPNVKFGLTEHYYGYNIDNIYQNGKTKLLEDFDKFIKSEINKEVKEYFEDKSNILFIEAKEKDFESMKIQIENIPELMGINVYAQPDFGIITTNKDYIIYDRKYGKVPNKDKSLVSNQLKVYAYKILQKIGIENVDNFNIKGFEVYLKNLEKFGGKITKQDLEDIEKTIISDTTIQKQFLINQDVEKNQPLPSENFPRTNDLQKCSNCTFYKVCEELKKFEKTHKIEEINNIDNSVNNDDEYNEDGFPF